MRKGQNNSCTFVENEENIIFLILFWLYYTPAEDTPLFLMTPWKQGSKKKRLFGANYSQHVLYTTFNELDWRCGHWLWLARPVTEDEPCNLPHVTPVMCTTSPSASNSPLRLQWSRDEAPLKQHNSSRSVSTHWLGRGWRGVELGAHSHNYNN